MVCAGCSQHKLYVIGADEEQFNQLKHNLKHSGIKVIRQNNLTSDFEQLTLVSAIAYPIQTVEAAIDQMVYTTLAQGKNQFYTDSAGLYFPAFKPKLVDIFTNTCNSLTITLTTFEGNFFKLTAERFIESEHSYEYVTIAEYQGTFTTEGKIINAYDKDTLLFSANLYHKQATQVDPLAFTLTNIPEIKKGCIIFKRKNHL